MTTLPARVYLDVPFDDKDSAKAAGARWDQAARRWYDPRPAYGAARPELAAWAARPEVPDLLPGEDREFGSGLFVDMVPDSCWFTNLRTCVSQQDWERLRRMITRRAGHRCEACGRSEDRQNRRWLEAHERWHYDERTGVQALRRLVCLCSSCHLSTHLGHANVTGRADEALTHLAAVTGMTPTQVGAHVQAVGQLWLRRSRRTWALDLSILTDAAVTLARPEGRAARRARAAAELQRQAPNPAPAAPTPSPAEQPRTEPPGFVQSPVFDAARAAIVAKRATVDPARKTIADQPAADLPPAGPGRRWWRRSTKVVGRSQGAGVDESGHEAAAAVYVHLVVGDPGRVMPGAPDRAQQ